MCKVDSLIIYHFISDCFTFGYLYVLWKNALPIVLDGFKKLVSTDHGGIRSENPEWEFYHQYFMQGKVEWLENIKRKVSFIKILRIKIDIELLPRSVLFFRHIRESSECILINILELCYLQVYFDETEKCCLFAFYYVYVLYTSCLLYFDTDFFLHGYHIRKCNQI